MGFFDELRAIADPTGIRRLRREVLGDPGGWIAVDRLEEDALRYALQHRDLWFTNQAPRWRSSGWPGETVDVYQAMCETWLEAVGDLLVDAHFDPETDEFRSGAA